MQTSSQFTSTNLSWLKYQRKNEPSYFKINTWNFQQIHWISTHLALSLRLQWKKAFFGRIKKKNKNDEIIIDWTLQRCLSRFENLWIFIDISRHPIRLPLFFHRFRFCLLLMNNKWYPNVEWCLFLHSEYKAIIFSHSSLNCFCLSCLQLLEIFRGIEKHSMKFWD